MHVVVCVKQIVDLQQIRIRRDTRAPIVEGLPLVLSDIDKNAVEEAVRLKERRDGVTVTLLSLGSPRLRETVKEALAMGADQAVLLTDSSLQGGDPMSTAVALAAAIRKLGQCDLILLGEGSADNYSGQVGPRLAELLGLPDITFACRIEQLTDSTVQATRSLDDGLETVEADLPAVVTVLAEINQPRIPALPHILRAARKPVQEWTADVLGLAANQAGAAAAGVRQLSNLAPLQERKGILFTGDPDEAARQLANALVREGVARRP